MAEDTCGAVFVRIDDRLTCHLPAKHINPTGAQPQGSPHESSELDSLTDEPIRWWG